MKKVDLTSFREGGFMWEGEDITITKACFGMYNFKTRDGVDKGKSGGLLLDIEIGGNAQDTLYFGYDFGNEEFLPTKDGKWLEAVGAHVKLNPRWQTAIFLQSAFDAGLPTTVMESQDITKLNGMVITGKMVPFKAGKGDNAVTRAVDTIVSMPGENGNAPVTDTGSTEDTVAMGIMEVLSDMKNNLIPKNKLMVKLSKLDALTGIAKGDITRLVLSDAWLGARDEFVLEGGVLKLE